MRRVLTFYKFQRLDDPDAMREALERAGVALDLKGTLLIAREGINGTIVGTEDALRGMQVVEGEPLPMFTYRYARIPVERAVEFTERITELAEEFIDQPRAGDTVFGILAGIFPTDHPALPDEDTNQ